MSKAGNKVSLKPYENSRGKEEEEEIRDLEKLRKEYKNDYIPTEEDLKLIEEQKENGKLIESFFLRERELRNKPEKYPLDDYTKILYRLPITEAQREIIYNNLIQQTDNSKAVVE